MAMKKKRLQVNGGKDKGQGNEAWVAKKVKGMKAGGKVKPKGMKMGGKGKGESGWNKAKGGRVGGAQGFRISRI